VRAIIAPAPEWLALPPTIEPGPRTCPGSDCPDLEAAIESGSPLCQWCPADFYEFKVGDVLAVVEYIGYDKIGWVVSSFVRVAEVLPILEGFVVGQWPGPHVEAFPDAQFAWHNTSSGDCSQIDLPNATPGGVALRLEACECPTCDGSKWDWAYVADHDPCTDDPVGDFPCPTCTYPITVTDHGGPILEALNA
jgi:hypothetical protein